ncbi:hypothetical protein BD309DRAFT_964564 [Dichomitus squalens]|nr:hypothetical protein BD309DRAFT_964564 [Dichomitus squalens]
MRAYRCIGSLMSWRCPCDVVAITVMGRPTLILGSVKAANDLLDAKGRHYLLCPV